MWDRLQGDMRPWIAVLLVVALAGCSGPVAEPVLSEQGNGPNAMEFRFDCDGTDGLASLEWMIRGTCRTRDHQHTYLLDVPLQNLTVWANVTAEWVLGIGFVNDWVYLEATPDGYYWHVLDSDFFGWGLDPGDRLSLHGETDMVTVALRLRVNEGMDDGTTLDSDLFVRGVPGEGRAPPLQGDCDSGMMYAHDCYAGSIHAYRVPATPVGSTIYSNTSRYYSDPTAVCGGLDMVGFDAEHRVQALVSPDGHAWERLPDEILSYTNDGILWGHGLQHPLDHPGWLVFYAPMIDSPACELAEPKLNWSIWALSMNG